MELEEKRRKKAYMRKWNRKNPDHARELWRKARTGEAGVRRRERDKAYYLKTKANGKRAEYRKKMKFINSVRDWTLYHFKGIKKECENCHSTEQLQFHHFVYRIPSEREDFMILCRPCHELLDRKNPGEPIGDEL